ncbi:MAG: hypothetical protein JXQ75_02495 [Phycisphaerae bacterium]|nr:hypothetical protein [Phycisphaerae bacterium]
MREGILAPAAAAVPSVAMRKRPQINQILKWSGVFLCVLILVMMAATLKWKIYYVMEKSAFSLAVGGIGFGDWSMEPAHLQEALEELLHPPGWKAVPMPWRAMRLEIPYFFRWPRVEPGGLALPLWLPFAIVAIPTAFMFWRDRRRHPAHHCRSCGYNLTGNVSGVCAECGTPIPKDSKKPEPIDPLQRD